MEVVVILWHKIIYGDVGTHTRNTKNIRLTISINITSTIDTQQ